MVPVRAPVILSSSKPWPPSSLRDASLGIRSMLAPSRPISVTLKSTAGLAGLIKVALALHHGSIPPSLNHETPNPAIPWTELPLIIPRSRTPWPKAAGV